MPDAAQHPMRPEFRELFHAHAPFVWRVLRRHGVPEPDLEDVCQEVFVVVHRRLASFEGRSTLRTWIYEIARRSALAHARRRGDLRTSTTSTDTENLQTEAPSPEACLQRGRELSWLEAALARLHAEQREAFVLYELEELTLAEVAEAQGCAINTVHYRVNKVRETLKRQAGKAPSAVSAALTLPNRRAT